MCDFVGQCLALHRVLGGARVIDSRDCAWQLPDKLLREVRRDTLSALDRKQLAEWKVRGRSVIERMGMKRSAI